MAERGVRIALDDVMLSGTNLALLTRCNFGMVKLSSELTSEVRSGLPAPQWLDGLRSLLHTSLLTVIAEGVETDFQARSLRAAGVQFAQGYLYSTPLRSREMFDFYAAHRARVTKS
jgi:EAL domain-containing protein (putative c-di-GMP-specific phosphodiesterase class I)